MKSLRSEQEIMKNWKGDVSKPLVSISCITYNHELYIEDSLEGFLIQETDFPFEILIHDDASTDGTTDIIREYEARYPNLIKPIYQIENQWSKGNKPGKINCDRAKGEYIAFCEGDDYWINCTKLQKQVEYLKNNSDCSWCFHSAKIVLMDGTRKDVFSQPIATTKNGKYTAKDVIVEGGGFFPTASSMFRASIFNNIPDWYYKAPIGDFPLALIASSQGDIGYIDEVMCVYRHLVPGSWSANRSKKYNDWSHHIYVYKRQKEYLENFNTYSNRKFEKYLNDRVVRCECNLFFRAFFLPVKNNYFYEVLKRLESIGISYNCSYFIKFFRIIFFNNLNILMKFRRKAFNQQRE